MLTLAQITAIISLLAAFGVPQAKLDEVRLIMEHKSVVVAPPAHTGAPGVVLPYMKPAYTYDEFLKMMHEKEKAFLKKPIGFAEYRYLPVVVTNITKNSVTLGYSVYGLGIKESDREIRFNGTSITDEVIKNLTPDTTYTYTFKWKEEGREDTVFEGTFKTLK